MTAAVATSRAKQKQQSIAAKREKRGKRPKVQGADADPVPRECFTIAEFCKAHRISQALYFKMKRMDKGPREMHSEGRVTISLEAAKEWRQAREVEAEAHAEHLRRERKAKAEASAREQATA
jgi:hypothetical protein